MNSNSATNFVGGGKIAFSPVVPSNIDSGLQNLFEQMRGEDGSFIHAASCNALLVSTPAASDGDASCEAALLDFTQKLAELRPSRFFAIVIEAGRDDISAGISAQCHGLSKTEHVCSEVILLRVGPNRITELSALIRSCLIPGVITEFYLTDPQIELSLAKGLLEIGDRAYFNSGQLEPRRDLVRLLAESPAHLIDMQWVALGPWRDQVKELFERVFLQSKVDGISRVEIFASCSDDKTLPFCALLFAGWLVDRLNLTIVKYSKGVFLLERSLIGSKQPQIIEIAAICSRISAGSDTSKVDGIKFRLANKSGADTEISLERGGDSKATRQGAEILDTIVQDSQYSLHYSRPLEDESLFGLYRRYISVGESISNFRRSFGAAVRMLEIYNQNG